MKWNFAAGLLTIFLVDMHSPPPADACGVKLTVKSQAPRKAVARTSNPSDVLLVGDPPRRLERDLAAAGHRVEVAPSASAAKKRSYAVVITDARHQDEARSRFKESVVMVRSGDVVADARSVEKQVARKPVRADEGRAIVAARPSRTPIAAGPQQDPSRRMVASKEPETRTAPEPTPAPAATPAPTPTPTPAPTPAERAVTTTAKPAPAEVPATRPAPEPKPKAVAGKALPSEVYFGLSSYKLGGQMTGALARTVRWLTANPDVQVVVEGHADPTGTPEGNMALAQQRAELVRDHLVSAGIDASRIEVVSYGDTRLKYSRTDHRNRRAAIVAK